MPDLVIRKSKNCYNLDNGNTLCNVVLEDKEDDSLLKKNRPISFIANGNIKKVKNIKGCWTGKDGKVYCLVDAKGKDGGKDVIMEANVGHHISPDSINSRLNNVVRNNRSIPRRKCDPEKDDNCPIYY